MTQTKDSGVSAFFYFAVSFLFASLFYRESGIMKWASFAIAVVTFGKAFLWTIIYILSARKDV